MGIELSILIPSIPEREGMLAELTWLLRQVPESVEVIYDNSESYLNGGLSIGKKREGLVRRAKGKYCCFIDDDDTISPDYIETVLGLCAQDKDICTFRTIIKLKDYWGLVDMRLLYKVNDQASPEYTIRRPPWHISPVRTNFAKMYELRDINNAEDFEWFSKVLSHCTTEAHTDRILFQYNHGDNSEADKIPLP